MDHKTMRSPIILSANNTIRSPITLSMNNPIKSPRTLAPVQANTSGNIKSFIIPLDIHMNYGVIDIPGIEVISIEQSTRAKKKYAITIKYDGVTKTIHYGNSDYQQYEDRTPVKAFSGSDHHDNTRRNSYLARASKIQDSTGLAANNPFSANRYSIITLW